MHRARQLAMYPGYIRRSIMTTRLENFVSCNEQSIRGNQSANPICIRIQQWVCTKIGYLPARCNICTDMLTLWGLVIQLPPSVHAVLPNISQIGQFPAFRTSPQPGRMTSCRLIAALTS